MKITLKDNVVAEVNKGTTVYSVINGISESLAKSAICGKINGVLVDLNAEIGRNCKLEIITQKDKDAINVLWHSSSHILAQAVKSIYPNAKLASGSSYENGFYYDFDFKTPISKTDLPRIEEEMQNIINANFKVVSSLITKEQAFLMAEEAEEPYKLEIINKIPANESVMLFSQGDFSDFCLGPHIKSTGLVKSFKLTNIEKTYWENDPENKQLTRITGVSFFYKKDLDQFLKNEELITKRNHMKLGAEKKLFARDSMTDRIVFLKNGQRIYNSILEFLGNLSDEYGFAEISLINNDNKTSGVVESTAYRAGSKDSYDYPIKYFIKEIVEPKIVNLSNGLFDYNINTRDKFVVFSRADQVDGEFKNLFEMVKEFYSAFGFSVGVRLHVGDSAIIGEYTKIKTALKRAIDKSFGSLNKIQSGYHKLDVLKVEYLLNDNLGREWSIGSLHVDFSYAMKNGIAFNNDGKLEFPITIVSNVCKSIEKLIAIMIENSSGELPFWLMPVQTRIVATDTKAIQKAKKIAQNLNRYKIYSDLYLAHRGKIKADSEIPLTIVIGEKEMKSGAVRVITKNSSEVAISLKKLLQTILKSKVERKKEVPDFI